MKTIQVILPVEDEGLEERIENLEKRCKKINISLQDVFQATATNMPNKPFVDILLSLSDIEVSDMESSERMKQFFEKFNVFKRNKREWGKVFCESVSNIYTVSVVDSYMDIRYNAVGAKYWTYKENYIYFVFRIMFFIFLSIMKQLAYKKVKNF